MAAISRTLVEGTWLKILRYQCTMPLIALRIAQPISLGIEQGVQRLLYGAPHHPVEVARRQS